MADKDLPASISVTAQLFTLGLEGFRIAIKHTARVISNAFPPTDRKRLAQVQVELDQCWDLLRQRRALRDGGLDPDEAALRPQQVVENYEQ